MKPVPIDTDTQITKNIIEVQAEKSKVHQCDKTSMQYTDLLNTQVTAVLHNGKVIKSGVLLEETETYNIQSAEAKPVEIKIEPARSTVPAKPVSHGFKEEPSQHEDKSTQDPNESQPIDIFYYLNEGDEVLVELSNYILYTGIVTFVAPEMLFLKRVSKILNNYDTISLSDTEQPIYNNQVEQIHIIHYSEEMDEQIINIFEKFKTEQGFDCLQNNHQEQKEINDEPNTEEITNNAKYCVNGDIYGNITPTFQFIKEAEKQRFKVPQCADIENSILVSGCQELKTKKSYKTEGNYIKTISKINETKTQNVENKQMNEPVQSQKQKLVYKKIKKHEE
ncbi:Hypothetical_protein [Hexamita inflata]|uniref:Hypothetical_protein n=1 Tax=Hexamita inflata TaxID=28002 RepID=A0ABP1HGC8_9EUKA